MNKSAGKTLDFLKVVRMVFWSGVVGPGTKLSLARSLALRARRSALVRSRFALTVALRAQKLDLWASLARPLMITLQVMKTSLGFNLRECLGSTLEPLP